MPWPASVAELSHFPPPAVLQDHPTELHKAIVSLLGAYFVSYFRAGLLLKGRLQFLCLT